MITVRMPPDRTDDAVVPRQRSAIMSARQF
jgi:hypothetical protein